MLAIFYLSFYDYKIEEKPFLCFFSYTIESVTIALLVCFPGDNSSHWLENKTVISL